MPSNAAVKAFNPTLPAPAAVSVFVALEESAVPPAVLTLNG